MSSSHGHSTPSSQAQSTSSPAATSSRRGGVAHQLRDWYSSPTGSDPKFPSPDRVTHRSIAIASWNITTTRGAIGNSAYMDDLGQRLGVPPPEMVFPTNTLVVTHTPTGFAYRFNAEEALRCVEGVAGDCRLTGADLSQDWRTHAGTAGSTHHHARRTVGEKPKRKNKAIKVAYAEEWGKSRNDPANMAPLSDPSASTSGAVPDAPSTAFGAAAATQIAEARDYDWTYSTTWAGSSGTASGTDSEAHDQAHSQSSEQQPSAPPPPSIPAFAPATSPSTDRIPVERLGPSSGEPILFYDDLVLFEDELGDNGSSMLGVKIRVMPSGFLILQRFFLRVDDVVFRLFDTRMYCAFDEPGVGQTSAASMPPSAAPWARTGAPPSSTPSSAPGLERLTLGAAKANLGPSPSATQSAAGRTEQRLIRELSGCEAPYKEVKARLPPYRPNDLSLLTDPGWVSQTLQTITARQFAASAHAAGSSAPRQPALATTDAAQSVLPARHPGADAPGSSNGRPQAASILGEVGDEDAWEGVGQRVDVVALC
ncbi:unnamed protein product [Parajaminaea phylloscopi]